MSSSQLLPTGRQDAPAVSSVRRCGTATELHLTLAQLLANENVAWLLIADDLMAPTIPVGAMALIDLTRRDPVEGEVLAFHANCTYQIGRLIIATQLLFDIGFDKPGEESVLVAPEAVEITGAVIAVFWNRSGFEIVDGVPFARSAATPAG